MGFSAVLWLYGEERLPVQYFIVRSIGFDYWCFSLRISKCSDQLINSHCLEGMQPVQWLEEKGALEEREPLWVSHPPSHLNGPNTITVFFLTKMKLRVFSILKAARYIVLWTENQYCWRRRVRGE